MFEELLLDKKLDLEELSIADFVCINLDLMLYKSKDLLNVGFHMLVRFHQQRHSLLQLLKQVQILEDRENVATLKKVDGQLSQLRKLAESSEFWLGSIEPAAII